MPSAYRARTASALVGAGDDRQVGPHLPHRGDDAAHVGEGRHRHQDGARAVEIPRPRARPAGWRRRRSPAGRPRAPAARAGRRSRRARTAASVRAARRRRCARRVRRRTMTTWSRSPASGMLMASSGLARRAAATAARRAPAPGPTSAGVSAMVTMAAFIVSVYTSSEIAPLDRPTRASTNANSPTWNSVRPTASGMTFQ